MQTLQGIRHSDRWSTANDGASVSLLRPTPGSQPIRFAAEPKPIEADIARSALIIIDMQNDFALPPRNPALGGRKFTDAENHFAQGILDDLTQMQKKNTGWGVAM